MRTIECTKTFALATLALTLHPIASSARPVGTGITQIPAGSHTARGAQRLPLPGEFNVLFIVLDDTGTDQLKAYYDDAGPPSYCASAQLNAVRTPYFDELRADGVLYTRFYVNPTCTPSRASFMTGRHGRRNGMGMMINEGATAVGLPNSEVTLAEVLRTLNPTYRRGAFGKWHLTKYEGDDCHPIVNGFEVFKGIHGNPVSHYEWRKTEASGDGSTCGSSSSGTVGGGTPNESIWDAAITSADALDWIVNDVGADPFFAYVCFSPPHVPWEAPPFSTISTLTAARLSLANIVAGQEQPLDPPLEKLIYRSNIEAVDYEVEQLITGIPQSVRDRTMIFIAGDNGTVGELIDDPQQLGLVGHGKRSVFELGTRAPMLVKGPLVSASARGGTCRNLVSAVDVWRTIANVTGVTNAALDVLMTGTTIDSRSFLASIGNPSSPAARTTAFFEQFANGLPLSTVNIHRGITNGSYRYKYRINNSAITDLEALFHTQMTPCESEDDNLLGGPPLGGDDLAAYNQLVAAMNSL